MNGNTFRMPARRLVTVAAATALAAGPAVLAGAGTAQATGDHGSASATVLRTALDVSLLNKTVNVPLEVTLNEVHAPETARKTALTAQLDGVDGGKAFSVLRADVAESSATATAAGSEGRTNLARARLHVPGLPLLSVVEVEQVTSTATCEAGKKPVADANLLGAVTVLGKKVTLTTGGTTQVRVPGVGEVRLDLSRTETTSRTAAATALELKVSVDPLDLNVAEVDGTLTLAKATCESPAAPEAEQPPAKADEPPAEQETEPAADVQPQGARAEADLAETGGSSATPYLAAGAAALVLAGGGSLLLARRRRG
ncbi:putative secreted protein [Streptomyces ambofaciens ATCC 23877]|uniref:Putative secreted protein n=1 Tax=Streptomyces ambofaciens (strain ATCC 23877 / 3486 / DSM 40053 / JCM 4204 / NBRC 12836 / NRRL B-2516) TaxID=278992 RepID=A0A0K2APQ3_STRA7|nr:SCO1860 family LAETG-anchored protein [Streptomyces ambofaciens]AKZ54983.1 putative secreted protein [Streptomyces ambofaciens ATCC 23877]